MPDPVTNNYSITLPTVGGDGGTWGTILNSGVMTVIDGALGANFSTVITSADVTLTTTQFQNAIFVVSGTLTGNRNLIVPFSTNFLSTTCVGGRFVVVNNGAGAFNLSVKTATTGGSSAIVPQGFAASLYSDGKNVGYVADGLPSYAKASNGTPTSLPGTAATVNTNASIAYDYANNKLYVCTTSSTTAATWTLPVTAIPAPPTFYTPDVQVFTSGSSATYTTATNGGNRPLYLRVRMVAGGGGGGAATSNAGSNGGDTSFSGWTAIHGNAGTAGAGAGGTGGTGGASGTGTVITRVNGQSGGLSNSSFPGSGGSSFYGGGGLTTSGGNALTGVAAQPSTGSGGSGGGNGSTAGSGGGAAEYVEFIITSPAVSYVYTVGTAGAGGAAGGQAGGNGAAGRIEVIGYWQ